MSLTTVPASGRIGPGLRLSISGTLAGAGPPYSCNVTLKDPSTGAPFVTAVVTHGATATFSPWLGVSENYATSARSFITIGAGHNGIADGTACTMDVSITDSAFALTDSGTYTMAWDAVSGLLNLLWLAGQMGSAMESAILDAVTVQAY